MPLFAPSRLTRDQQKAVAYINNAISILNHQWRCPLNPVYWTDKYQSKAKKREACAKELLALKARVEGGSIKITDFITEFCDIVDGYRNALKAAGEYEGLSKEVCTGWLVAVSGAAWNEKGLNHLQYRLRASARLKPAEVELSIVKAKA